MNKIAKFLTTGFVAGSLLLGLEGVVKNNAAAAPFKRIVVTPDIFNNIPKQTEHDVPLFMIDNAGLQHNDQIYADLNSQQIYIQRGQEPLKPLEAFPTLSENADTIKKLANVNDPSFFPSETVDIKTKGEKSSSSTDSKFATRHSVDISGAYLQQNIQDDTIGIVNQKVDEDGVLIKAEYNLQSAPFIKGLGLDASAVFNFLYSKYTDHSSISGENAPGFNKEIGGRLSTDIEAKMGFPTFNLGNGKYFFHIVPMGYLTRFQNNTENDFLSESKRSSKDNYQGLWTRIELVGKYMNNGRIVGLEYQSVFGEKGTDEGAGKTEFGNGHKFIVYLGTPEWKLLRTMLNAKYERTARKVNYSSEKGKGDFEFKNVIAAETRTRITDHIDVIVAAKVDNWDFKQGISVKAGARFNFGDINPEIKKQSATRKASENRSGTGGYGLY